MVYFYLTTVFGLLMPVSLCLAGSELVEEPLHDLLALPDDGQVGGSEDF
jgi:hypothetical protein